jgi:hypothetical protein
MQDLEIVEKSDHIRKMGKSRFNEGKVCDAVIRWIEMRENASRQQLRFPEQEQHQHPVELTCVIGNRLFAFEHTGIEPFENQIRLEVEAHFAPLREQFSQVVPVGEQYELRVPAHAMRELTRTETNGAISALSDWIREQASKLTLAPVGRLEKPAVRQADSIVPFGVSLHRNSLPGVSGHLSVVHLVDKLDESRTQRIKRACEKKFPKLAAWKARSAQTVLVFEENDDQLTNVIGVTESFLAAEADMSNKPDEVYLVTTSHAPWYVWCVGREGRSFFDFTTPDERAYEVDPELLVPLTSR